MQRLLTILIGTVLALGTSAPHARAQAEKRESHEDAFAELEGARLELEKVLATDPGDVVALYYVMAIVQLEFTILSARASSLRDRGAADPNTEQLLDERLHMLQEMTERWPGAPSRDDRLDPRYRRPDPIRRSTMRRT